MLALTSAEPGPLVGVLVSVNTIPAAANAAVALANWVPTEAIGSAIQLPIDLSAIAVAKTLTLLLLRARTEQLTRRSAARVAYLLRLGVRPGVIIQSSELNPAK